MVQFEYNGVMKRYDVKVPFTLAGESDMVVVAAITENDEITLHREVSLKLLKNIILHWDEYESQMTKEIQGMQGQDNDISIDDMEWSARVWDILSEAGIRTIGELTERSVRDIRRLRNCGRKSLTEIEVKLDELGLTLKQ
tara:strand:- start:54 stop:473 length:420 start_codon:yes stop_codon:yes gene_type:complete